MNAFLSTLDSCGISKKDPCLKRTELTTLQVNMGNLCNQSCRHCHIGASPAGDKIMPKKVIDNILQFLKKNKGLILDITGGAPELNPHFDYFIVKARSLAGKIIVRSNLTVFYEPEKEYLPEFFKKNNIHLICSLPCYGQKNVDAQRGLRVFQKSIKALQKLNGLGYTKKKDLELDLVYNPSGAFLPQKQEELQKAYMENLNRDYDIRFNRLITITNVPIKRFKDYLDSRGEYSKYIELLKDNFNPQVIEDIMCRKFLSVGFDGKVYDCDFNQSLGWALKDKKGNVLSIDKVDLEQLEDRNIMVGEHCLSCTAGYGSSCQGVLSQKETDKIQENLPKYAENKKEIVKSYYAKVLKRTEDLKTNACCTSDELSFNQKKIIKRIHPEIRDKFYGCGSPLPGALEGCTVLDLGCGTGRDVYTACVLVGEKGYVIGVDMTDEQLSVAKKHIGYQMREFGFIRKNVEFKKGYIENLKEIGIKDNSIDVVISNCVINLSSDKNAVFSEIFRVLKPGGELYFSDVFTGRRMPEYLAEDPVLYAECLAGALYIEDFRRILTSIGIPDYRIVSKKRITLRNPKIELKAGMIDFYSLTVRAFKLNNLEDVCEDYGQIAIYTKALADSAHTFLLDDHHIFIKNKPMLVCGNTALMLQDTRYAKYFTIIGDRSTHFGEFKCAPVLEKIQNNDSLGGGCC